jgi:hypothetical protein
MLKIRREQVAALEADAQRRYIGRLIAHLRALYPSTTTPLSEADLVADVERGVVQAGRYGLEAEDDVRVFLECRVELGPDFDVRADTAWAGAVLRDDTLFGPEKADLLSDRVMFAPPRGAR